MNTGKVKARPGQVQFKKKSAYLLNTDQTFCYEPLFKMSQKFQQQIDAPKLRFYQYLYSLNQSFFSQTVNSVIIRGVLVEDVAIS